MGCLRRRYLRGYWKKAGDELRMFYGESGTWRGIEQRRASCEQDELEGVERMNESGGEGHERRGRERGCREEGKRLANSGRALGASSVLPWGKR